MSVFVLPSFSRVNAQMPSASPWSRNAHIVDEMGILDNQNEGTVAFLPLADRHLRERTSSSEHGSGLEDADRKLPLRDLPIRASQGRD